MNQNIRRLAQQAGLLVHNPHNQPTKLEHFAELLVLECVQLLGLESDYGKQHILKHFGLNK